MGGVMYDVMDRVKGRTPKIIVIRFTKEADVNTYVKFGNIVERETHLVACITSNAWVASTEKTCKELRDLIYSELEHVDAIFVSEITDIKSSKRVYAFDDEV